MNKLLIVLLAICLAAVHSIPLSGNRRYDIGSKNYADALSRESGRMASFNTIDNGNRKMAHRGPSKKHHQEDVEDDIISVMANKDKELRRNAISRSRS